jgi:beta-aspartyl-peptidase (threonine type)
VAGLRHVRNPIDLADAVRVHSDHVLLTGDGAETFARLRQLPLEENSYFFTDRRLRQLENWRRRQTAPAQESDQSLENREKSQADGLGTVGAVALDRRGNLAAGTSTGGMTAKKYGRVGDSPLIGAGTWADNMTCAVSATGHGEFFIRYVAAYDVHARMLYQRLPLKAAAHQVVMRQLKHAGGGGGMICLDRQGNVSTPCNQNYMARGILTADGRMKISLFMDE